MKFIDGNAMRNFLIRNIIRYGNLNKIQVKEIALNGAKIGCPGFTYSHDCTQFVDQHQGLVDEFLQEEIQALGCKNLLDLLQQMDGAKETQSLTQMKKLIAWYCLEKSCQLINDGTKKFPTMNYGGELE